MKVNWILSILVLCLVLQSTFGLLDKLMKNAKNKMKPNLFGKNKNKGKGGGSDNCNCPCREYWTTRCAVEYQTECKQLYTHRECKRIPVSRPMKVKETECQKCIRYYETVMETKSVRQCMDVYDEKCETKYPAKCVEDQSCTMIYQTKCESSGYNQKCQQVPVQQCTPITKCHRIPKTVCRPFTKEKCGKTRVQVPKKVMKSRCMPYGPRQSDDNLGECGNDNSPSSSYGAPSTGYGAPSSGYGTPAAPPVNNNVVADMQAPLPPPQAPPAPPPAPSNLTPNQDSQASQPAYGSAVAPPNTNQNTLNNVVQEYSIGNNGGSPVSAPNTYGSPVSAPDTYGSPVSAPDTYGSPVSAPNTYNSPIIAPETSGFLSAPDTYGSPVSAPDTYGSPINNNQNVLNNVVQEFSIGNQISVSAPSGYVSPTFNANINGGSQNNGVSAPNVYASPSSNGNGISGRLNPNFSNTRSNTGLQEEQRSVLANIKVVNPPALAQNFIPATNFIPSASSVQTQVHPNQLLRSDFTPSVRLPDNFIHQISADMLLDNNFQLVNNVQQNNRPEIFQVAGSIQDSMKKMVFPQSSEEFETENNNEVIISVADNIDDPVVEIENDDGDYYDEDYYDVQDSIQALLFTNQGLGEEKNVADSIQSTIELVKDDISKEQVANPDLRLKLKRKRRRRRRKKQEQQPNTSSSHTSLQSNFGDKIFG